MTTDPVLRPPLAHELPAAHGLAGAAGVAQGSLAQWEEQLGTPLHVHLVAVDGDRVVGVATATAVVDVADVLVVAVDPAERRRGTGARLVGALLDELAGRGVDRVLLEVRVDNVAALALYGRLGFVEVDRRARYYRDGTDAVVLLRELG